VRNSHGTAEAGSTVCTEVGVHALVHNAMVIFEFERSREGGDDIARSGSAGGMRAQAGRDSAACAMERV
jgi:hypothetical protein